MFSGSMFAGSTFGLILYRHALRLYPVSHRERFGDEMVAVFSELQAETATKGLFPRSLWCIREITGVLAGAWQEHWRAGGNSLWLWFPTRRLTMHNEFRFPKTTAVLMTIILAGVLMIIQRGEAIQQSLPYTNPPVAPIHPVHSTLLPGIVFGFVFFYAAGLIGWAILFALRRSGVHRLDETSIQPK